MPSLREFTVAPWWQGSLVWGSGHTVETDPTRQGWRVRRAGEEPDTALVGRRGVKGCFTAVPDATGHLIVRFFFRTPEELDRAIRSGEQVGGWIRTLPHIPGWGLSAIELLQELVTGRVGPHTPPIGVVPDPMRRY